MNMLPAKIGFVLLSHSSSPIPSTRISALNMFPYLEAAGYLPVVVFQPDTSMEEPDLSGLSKKMAEQGIEIAYFQKVHGKSALKEMGQLSKLGIKAVYGVCDLVKNDMAEAADATIVVTEYLKRLYDPSLHEKIHVVHDGIENPGIFKPFHERKNGKLEAVLVTSSELHEIPIIGSPPKFMDVTIVGRYPTPPSLFGGMKQAYWKIRSKAAISEKISLAFKMMKRDFRTVNWDIATAYKVMAEADIGIIPVDMRHDPLPGLEISYWQVKSENRLTMKMAMGLPVIASPVPSYEEVVVQGKNGFLASGRQDWMSCLEALRDPDLRLEMGRKARDSVIRRYSMEEQAAKLIRILDMLSGKRREADQKEAVT